MGNFITWACLGYSFDTLDRTWTFWFGFNIYLTVYFVYFALVEGTYIIFHFASQETLLIVIQF